MAHKSVTGKAQVTVRITPQFAKDLNLILACSKADSTTAAVQDAVHQLAEYYRHVMQRTAEQRAAVQHDPGKAVLCTQCHAYGFNVCQ